MEPAPSQRIIDWNAARESVGGDEELLNDVIRAFVSDAPRQLDALRTAIRSGDATSARRAAHTLKGNSRYFGAQDVAAEALVIEEQAQQGILTDLDQRVGKLDAALEKLLSLLLDYLQADQPGPH